MAIASISEMFFANRWMGLQPAQPAADSQAVAAPDTAPRCLVWIDGVGSYLLLAANRVTIGRASSNDEADVALTGPLARQHSAITRIGDDYVIEPLQATRVNAQPLDQAAMLSHGAQIVLNEAVYLNFVLPTPLSTTARLDVTSAHRGPIFVNGILLMADTCLFGPGPENHVRCPGWSGSVVLVKRPGGFAVRSQREILIDGQQQRGIATVSFGQTVSGPDFRFRLEECGSSSCKPRLI